MMHTFIVLLVWMTPFGVPTCEKFAVAAMDQEQAVELAFKDVDTTPDIVASIRLNPTRIDKPMVLINADLVGDACTFSDSGGFDGSTPDTGHE